MKALVTEDASQVRKSWRRWIHWHFIVEFQKIKRKWGWKLTRSPKLKVVQSVFPNTNLQLLSVATGTNWNSTAPFHHTENKDLIRKTLIWDWYGAGHHISVLAVRGSSFNTHWLHVLCDLCLTFCGAFAYQGCRTQMKASEQQQKKKKNESRTVDLEWRFSASCWNPSCTDVMLCCVLLF